MLRFATPYMSREAESISTSHVRLVSLRASTVFVNPLPAVEPDILVRPPMLHSDCRILCRKCFHHRMRRIPCGLEGKDIVRGCKRLCLVKAVSIPFGSPVVGTPAVPCGFAVLPQIIPCLLAEREHLPVDILPRLEKGFLACGRNVRQTIRIDCPAKCIHFNEVLISTQSGAGATAFLHVKARWHRDDAVKINRADPVFGILNCFPHSTDGILIAGKADDVHDMVWHTMPPFLLRAKSTLLFFFLFI